MNLPLKRDFGGFGARHTKEATLLHIKVAPKGMGLNDFAAFEEGFFAEEGLDVELDWKTFRGTQSSWKGMEYFERPQDKAVNEQVIQCACLWGTISNASAGMGLIVPDCYGVSPWAIFARPDSTIRQPEDLRDVPIAIGMRAGSHFNVPYRLEKYIPLDHIRTVNIGGFGARLKALLEGEVEAASLLPPQIDMARQLGLREIIADEFRDALVGSGGRSGKLPCAATCADSIAPNAHSRRICRNTFRYGVIACRRSFRIRNGTSADSLAGSVLSINRSLARNLMKCSSKWNDGASISI